MSQDRDVALRELAVSSAEAAAAALRTFLPEAIEVGDADVVSNTPPLDGLSVPAIVAEIHYTGGASGGTLFVTTVNGVKKIAAAVMGTEAVLNGEPLGEDERDAVAEAMHQMMGAAAGATGAVLDDTVAISEVEVRDIETVADAIALGDSAPHATVVSLTLDGEPCKLVNLVPKAFVLKMTRALDDLRAVALASAEADGNVNGPSDILRGVPLRVCAEIGRATMPMADAVSLPDGGLIELDRGAEEPVDVLVNGRRFATGRLVLVDGEWAVRIEEVLLDAADLDPAVPQAIERS